MRLLAGTGGPLVETRQAEAAAAVTRRRLLTIALSLELVAVLLLAAVVVFLAARLGTADDVSGEPASDRGLLFVVPPIALVLGLALIGARHAVDRAISGATARPAPLHRAALWLTALANLGLVATIATSLYHARASWIGLGVVLATASAIVAAGCVAAGRS